ncbi:MAG: glycoside hydrolase family 57 protein [Anaerolineae bacterium]|nr:glycoside hydrolase family 57 protein [Anaerolineae bacterium]
MRIWHMTADAGREPLRVAPGQPVRLTIGTSPIGPGQSVTVTYDVVRPSGGVERGFLSVPWDHNSEDASYWRATFGPFRRGDRVTYWVHGAWGSERLDLPPAHFAVGPRIYVALLWHQHQPSYVDLSQPPKGSMVQPWVRLNALRAYYAMPALGQEVPGARVTFNLSPVLLWQLDRYVEQGATDRLLDLTLKPVRKLTPGERDAILDEFFDVDWHSQIFPFPRYLELFERRREQLPFSDQDIRDLKMWYNLAWFAPIFQRGTVDLVTGQQASVQRFVERQGGFSEGDIEEMVAEQGKIMAAVVPLYRQLQDQGLIEVSTSPYYHPILPLLYDTDTATIDRPGACLPPRFSHPEDVELQVTRAVDDYRRRFARRPRGMWPSEGAVSRQIIPIIARHGFLWTASDQGVLERSGRWGYQADDPEVLAQPYQVRSDRHALSIFFRDSSLSNLISFHYHAAYQDMEAAAEDLVRRIARDVADRLRGAEDRILSIILDGENTWCAYGVKAPAFLRALYRRLSESPDVETVTFSEYLQGNPGRQVCAHPTIEQEPIYELYEGSWVDELGSEPGVDLGSWAGEPDENRAWGLLGDARDALHSAGATPETHPDAFEALYMAEGSDWFWWLGTDHPSPRDSEFESIFRLHLTNAYRLAGLEPPPELARPLVPWSLVWTLTQPGAHLAPYEKLTVRTNCPGTVTYRMLPRDELREEVLQAVGGPAGLARRYEATLGPFGPEVREVRVRFRCQEHLALQGAACVDSRERVLQVREQEEQTAG